MFRIEVRIASSLKDLQGKQAADDKIFLQSECGCDILQIYPLIDYPASDIMTKAQQTISIGLLAASVWLA